jgi:hypothetical protein
MSRFQATVCPPGSLHIAYLIELSRKHCWGGGAEQEM